MMPITIVIPVCGKGVRFQQEGFQVPKHALQVLDKEMICYVLDMIKRTITKEDHVFIVHYYGYNMKNIMNKYPFVKFVSISYYTRGAAETVYEGLHSILSFMDVHNAPCILLDCDTYYTIDILSIARSCTTNGVFYFDQNPQDARDIYSYIFTKMEHNEQESREYILDIAEKKRISDHANTGAYLFANTHVLYTYCKRVIEEERTFHKEYYTSCVIKTMLEDNHVFEALRLEKEDVIFLGTPAQVQEYTSRVYAFLMDMDGTLVITDNIYMHVWREMLAPYHMDITGEVYKTCIQGQNDQIALNNLFGNNTHISITELSTMKDALFKKHIHLLDIVPNGVNFIRKVKRLGHKVVIVTNANRGVAEEIIRHIGIEEDIDGIVVGNECNKPKPFPDPYKNALRLLNIPGVQAIVFEDSAAGILSARGIFPRCIVGVYQEDNAVLERYKTDFQIQDYDEICLEDIMAYQKNPVLEIYNMLQQHRRMLPFVADFQIGSDKLKGGFIADVIPVNLVLKDENRVIHCVLKLRSDQDTIMTRMADMLCLHEREFYFYQNIAPYINVCVPYSYGVVKDEELYSKGMLLEDINTPDFVLNLDLSKESIDVSLRVVRRMAEMHARFACDHLQDVFPQLKKHNDPCFKPTWGNYIRERWSVFEERWSFMMTPASKALMRSIYDHFDDIQEYLSNGILTLCHGDIKSANIFYRKETGQDGMYEPYFIDWQYIAYGKGVQDLVFFIIESFDKNTAHRYTSLFKNYYYEVFYSNSACKDYGRDVFEKDFTLACCYFPFFVCIWFGTTNKN
jgi:HAD superfamily hydrolase (TIGR01509 family)